MKILFQYGFTIVLSVAIIWFFYRTIHRFYQSIKGQSAGCHGGAGEDSRCCNGSSDRSFSMREENGWRDKI